MEGRFSVVLLGCILLFNFMFSCRIDAERKTSSRRYSNRQVKIDDINVSFSSEKDSFEFVHIGKQIWMQYNLNVEVFRNGDTIFQAKSNEEWVQAGKENLPAWCYYHNMKENGEKYGKLYNWYAVNDSRGLAPVGWKIPKEEDWKQLLIKYNGLPEELMSKREWPEEYGGNNKSGFNSFPSGGRFYRGKFKSIGEGTCFWSSSQYNDLESTCFMLNFYLPMLTSWSKSYGLSVRCIKKR